MNVIKILEYPHCVLTKWLFFSLKVKVILSSIPRRHHYRKWNPTCLTLLSWKIIYKFWLIDWAINAAQNWYYSCSVCETHLISQCYWQIWIRSGKFQKIGFYYTEGSKYQPSTDLGRLIGGIRNLDFRIFLPIRFYVKLVWSFWSPLNTIWAALDFLGIFNIFNNEIFPKVKIQSIVCVKMAVFDPLTSAKIDFT